MKPKRSKYPCPECGRMLICIGRTTTLIWCDSRKCRSKLCRDGMAGLGDESAYQNLVSAFNLNKTYPCPCCGKPMKHCTANRGAFRAYEMWCGHGPCQSYATNNGAIAPTLEECAATIESAYERELERKERLGWSNSECGE